MGQPPGIIANNNSPLGPQVATPNQGMNAMNPQNLFNNYTNVLNGTAPSAYQPNFANTGVPTPAKGPGASPQALNPAGMNSQFFL